MRYSLPFIVVCLLVLSGCAGIQYTDQIIAVPLAPEKPSRDTRVLAKAEAWRNSGVVVEKGNKYLIKAKGRWNAGPT